jgi:hypothetical protein
MCPSFGIQRKILQKPGKTSGVKFRIDGVIKPAHIFGICVPEEKRIIRNKKDILPDIRIVIYRSPVYFYLPDILPEDAADHPQESALAGTVCADQTEYLPVFDLQGHIIYSSDAPESFCKILYSDHFLYSPSYETALFNNIFKCFVASSADAKFSNSKSI